MRDGRLKGLEVDVAVMEWWHRTPGFLARVWRIEELLVIVLPQHPWAGLRSIPRHWGKGQTFLGNERGAGTGRVLQHYPGEDAVTIDLCMQLCSTEAVKHPVHAGLGISLVRAAAGWAASR